MTRQNEEWKVADEVPGSTQAEILKGMLEAQGINVILSEEGAGRALGLGTGPTATVQILVPESSLEEARAANQEQQVAIGEFKEMVAAPYAAIGDALFWGGLRPLAAGIALFFAAKGILLAPLVFLLLFNAVPMVFRVSGYIRGYQKGVHSVEFFQRRRLPDWAIHTKEAAIVVLGGLSAFLVFQHLQKQELVSWLGLLTLIPMIVLGLLARRGISTLLLTLLSAIIIILLSLFWADAARLIGM